MIYQYYKDARVVIQEEMSELKKGRLLSLFPCDGSVIRDVLRFVMYLDS